jgi:hypothetical protein
MNTATANSFENLLQHWERCFATPVVEGELESWAATLREVTDEIRMRLRQRMDETHQREFDDIEAQDPALVPRVEQLKHDDQALWEDFENMVKKIAALHDQVLEEPKETDKLHHAAQVVAERGLEMVVHIRKQETAVATWLMEAFQRDRGVAD